MNVKIDDWFRERLDQFPFLILDGAVGTLLENEGYLPNPGSWTAEVTLKAPGLLYRAHEAYVQSGADIITTHTFRTTPQALGEGQWETALNQAVSIARQAAGTTGCVAGSVAPVADCFRPDLAPDYRTAYTMHCRFIEKLQLAGVDFVLAETMNTIRECLAFIQAAEDVDVPFALSIVSDGKENLLSGESIALLLEKIKEKEPLAVLVNCRPIHQISSAVHVLNAHGSRVIGVYANGPGKPGVPHGWQLEEDRPIERFMAQCEESYNAGCRIIGGCCGTTPAFVAALKSYRDTLFCPLK